MRVLLQQQIFQEVGFSSTMNYGIRLKQEEYLLHGKEGGKILEQSIGEGCK
jgi:hypothetical protein